MSKLVPLNIKNPLAPTPSKNLLFSKPVKLALGDDVEFSDPKALRAMVALMDMQATIGGAASHWGGPSAFSELVSAIYGVAFHNGQKLGENWYESYHLVNDAGHCEIVAADRDDRTAGQRSDSQSLGRHSTQHCHGKRPGLCIEESSV